MGKDIKSFRRLTVSSVVQPRFRSLAEFPKINIQGAWVEKAGFRIGESVAVFVSKGSICIRTVGEGGGNG